MSNQNRKNENTVFVCNEAGVSAVKKMTARLNPDSSITHFDERVTVILLKREFSRRQRKTIGKIICKLPDDNGALYEKVTGAIKYSGNGYD
jgi:hypothetical protein